MRTALTVFVAAGALMVPATAALAAPPVDVPSSQATNASCNNGKGGNYEWTGHRYNGKGNSGKPTTCAVPVADITPETPATPDLPETPMDPADPGDTGGSGGTGAPIYPEFGW